MPIIECIPNFSEGQRPEVIDAITKAIEWIPEVQLLHRDSGYAANRTVFTFAGPPAAVTEAADTSFQARYTQWTSMQVCANNSKTDACRVKVISESNYLTARQVHSRLVASNRHKFFLL